MMFNGHEITDGVHSGIEARKQRGLELAALVHIERHGQFYYVPSRTNPRPTKYKVVYSEEKQTCSCPDHETRGCKCKHIYAVEYTIQREQHTDGDIVTESVTE